MPDERKKATTKVQYKQFEPGEFVEELKRDEAEIIALIENFPWEKQREKIGIDLTGPSVTLQDDRTNYLKLSLFYNQKFVLQFFNGKDIYTRSLLRYTDAYGDISHFIDHHSINYENFKKEDKRFRLIKEHFVSKDFLFRVYPGRLTSYFTGETLFALWFSGFFLIAFLISLIIKGPGVLPLFFFLLPIFVFFGGIHLYLIRNYYRHSKGKMLQLSKGALFFIHGPMEAPVRYQKEDVREMTIQRNTRRRCIWRSFTVTGLHMKSGENIFITSLLMEGTDIQIRMPDIPVTTINILVPSIYEQDHR